MRIAIVNGLAVTMEQRDQDELVTCYDLRTGELRWSHALLARHEHPIGGIGPRGTPTIHKGLVYALGGTGVLRCIDGGTGELKWKVDIPDTLGVTWEEDQANVLWGRSASPLIVDDLVIVPAGGSTDKQLVSLAAYDRLTGSRVWHGGETARSATAHRVRPRSAACGRC